MNPVTASRIRRHQLAKQSFNSGKWNEVISILEPELQINGKNILPLIDLTWSYYFSGEIFRWENSVFDLQKQIDNSEHLLSANSFYNAFINLGKFYEEQGQLARALDCYTKPLLERRDLTQRQSFMLIAQSLRLNSFLNRTQLVAKQYTDLSLRIQSYSDYLYEVEIEHALILAELHLIGTERALHRYHILKHNRDLSDYDSRLLYFDILEFFLSRKIELTDIPERFLTSFRPNLATLDYFEQAILEIAFGSNASVFTILSKMSPVCALRILALQIDRSRTNPAEIVMSDLLQQARLLIGSLDLASQNFLLEKWGRLFAANAQTLMLDLHSSKVQGHVHVDLSKKKLLFQLLMMFETQTSIPIEKLVHELWQAEFNETYRDRVRMLVARTNKTLRETCMNSHMITIENDFVRLDSRIKIRRRE